jgi:hypothetical protein
MLTTERPTLDIDTDLLKFTPKQMIATETADAHKFTLFGGSRGPGKSYWLRWYPIRKLLEYATMGLRGVRYGLFCEDYPSLKDRQISKISVEFPDWLGTLKESKEHGLAYHLADEYGGGILALRNLDDPSKYQSAEFGGIAVDELTKNRVDTFNILRGSLRWPGIADPGFIAATNPGGIGHAWVKDYFIDKVYPPELRDSADRFAFVPALPDDNPHLDAAYWHDLETLPPMLAKAWRYGDWGVFAGQAFRDFTLDRHVCRPDQVPEVGVAAGTVFKGTDSGYTAPFCTLWGFREVDTGRVWVYREAYQAGLTDRQQAQMVKDMTPPNEPQGTHFADPSMWAKKNAHNIVTSARDEYAAVGIYLTKGDNDRVNGVRKIHRMLANLPDGRPGLIVSEQCQNLIKQLQTLAVDDKNPEDVDTKQEDHAFDALKYLLSNLKSGSESKPKPFIHPLSGVKGI